MTADAGPRLIIPRDILPVHQNAWTLLRAHGVTVTGVVRVNPESILYLGAGRCVMTAWLTYAKGPELLVETEPGMPAEPTDRRMPRGRMVDREAAKADIQEGT